MSSSDSEAFGFMFLICCFFLGIWLVMSTDNKPTCDLSIEASSKQNFITRATEKNIELLYVRLVFLNESVKSTFDKLDISAIYDPHRWVWTKSEQGKALLSLSYDYYILSLTTLARETGSTELSVITKPAGCFGRQYGHHQLKFVTNILMDTASVVSSNSLICHRFVQFTTGTGVKIIYQTTFATGLPIIQYRCCPVYNSDSGCSMVIVPNTALSFILRAIWIVACVAAFFTPLLIRYLPDDSTEKIFDIENSLLYELDSPGSYINHTSNTMELPTESGVVNQAELNEGDYIHFNATTPLTNLLLSKTCSLLCLRKKLHPRVSRFLLFSIVIPAILIVALVSYSIVLKLEVELQKEAEIKTDFVQMCLNPDNFLIGRIVAYIVSCLILCIPNSISDDVDESLILIGDLQNENSCCYICTAMKRKPDREVTGVNLLYENMLQHLKYLFTFQFWKLLLSFSSFPSRWLLHLFSKGERLPITIIWQPEETAANQNDGFSCCDKVMCVLLWMVLSPLWLIAFFIVASVIICLMIPIGYFLACVCFVPLVFLTKKFGNSVCTWLCFLICFSVNILSALFLIEMMTFSWNFVLKLVSFTLMGLVVGINYYMPFLVYILALFYYFQNVAWNMNDKYLKLKVMLFEECEKQQKELDGVPVLFIKSKKTEMPMIPKNLYEIVCQKYMPLKKTISSSLFSLVVIICFLTFAFVSIIAFGKWAKVPSFTEAIITALISTLPKMLRNSGKHAGWSLFKEKNRLYSVELVVSRFARENKNPRNNTGTNEA